LNECHDADIHVQEVRADPVIVHEIARSRTEVGVSHGGVQITADPASARPLRNLLPMTISWNLGFCDYRPRCDECLRGRSI
jgi:hypothetical protein